MSALGFLNLLYAIYVGPSSASGAGIFVKVRSQL